MDRKENNNKRKPLINLSKKSIAFLAGMLLIGGIIYIILPFELAVAVIIVICVIIAYESLRAILFWLASLIASGVRCFLKGVRRAIHVAKMPDEEFEAHFSAKSEDSEEKQNESSSKNEAEASANSQLPDLSDETNRASLLPDHARILPLTPLQAAAKAMDWWTDIGLDGLDGKGRLSKLIDKLRDEAPNETVYNIVEYGTELLLPTDFYVLQAVAQLLSDHGYEADAEEDTTSLYVIKPDASEQHIAGNSNDENLNLNEDGANVEIQKAEEQQLLLVKPGKSSKVITVSSVIEGIENLIGSDTTAIHPFDDSVALIHKMSSNIESAPLNRYVTTTTGDRLIIKDDFLVVGWNGKTFTSLPCEMADKYAKKFLNIPFFIKNPDQSYSIC